MSAFNNITYLGGLPHPYEVGRLSLSVDQINQHLVLSQSGQNLILPKARIYDVRTSIILSRSLGKAIVGYCVGNLINKQYGGLLGTALGAKSKDESELLIDYYSNANQIRTIILKPGKQVWNVYAAVYTLII